MTGSEKTEGFWGNYWNKSINIDAYISKQLDKK
jgi:hypothetical protein